MTASGRENPRISVNKLGEYITALPGRRKTIIKQQKRPPSFIVPYYRDAETIVIEYLTNFAGQDDWLDSKIQELSGKTTTSDWDETRRNICIDALDSFGEFVEELNFNGLSCIAGELNSQKLDVGGVQISVRPEIYLIDSEKNIRGCVKLVFGKASRISETEAGYIGICLQKWMTEIFGVSDYKNCLVLDIFGESCYVSPKAYKKRMSDVEAACEEIARAWGTA